MKSTRRNRSLVILTAQLREPPADAALNVPAGGVDWPELWKPGRNGSAGERQMAPGSGLPQRALAA